MTLEDKRIVVTRAPHQALNLVEMLRERGAVPLIYPCIDIAPPDDVSGLDSALRNINSYEWLIITSTNTVLAMKRRFQTMQIKPDLSRIKIAAVGETTAHALQDLMGVSPAIIPERQSADGIIEVMTVRKGMTILLPQSNMARSWLSDALIEMGANLSCVEAYQNVIGYGGEDVPEMLRQNRIDAVTFTSPSAVENFIVRIRPESASEIPAACIGATTGDAAIANGFQSVVIPEQHTLEAMLDSLQQFFDESR